MSKIILKKSSVVDKIPLPADLAYGELALNYADSKLFFKKPDNTIGTFSAGSALQNRYSYTATAAQTTFSASYTPPYVDVYLNGLRLSSGVDYTATTGSSIVLTPGAAVNDLVEIVAQVVSTTVLVDATKLALAGGTMTGVIGFAAGQTFPGTQTALVSGTSIKTINGTSVLGSGNIEIDVGVTSFNTRTGAVTLSSSDVTTALGFTPVTQTAVDSSISALVDSSPATLNTLNELAAALGDDPNFATTVSTSIAARLPLAGGTMTGAIGFAGAQTWPTFNQSTTGNAATATTLQTARTINGVSFNGSTDITIADATKLPLAGGTMTGAIGFAGAQTWPTFNQSTTGASARITVPDTRAVNDQPQNKTGNAITADFKENAAVGTPPVTASGLYSHVVTVAGWDTAGGSGGWPTQLSVGDGIAVRQAANATTWGAWRTVLHSNNFSSYALPLSGGSLTGSLTLTANSTSIRQNSTATWSGDAPNGVGKLEYHSNRWYINAGADSTEIVNFRRGATSVATISNTGVYSGSIAGNSATTSQTTFAEVYTNNWFRNNASNTGLYNQSTTQHLSSNTNGYWDMSSTTSVSAIRLFTGGHVSALRGYVYADTSNQIGFLNTSGNWSWKVDNSGNGTSTGFIRTSTNFYADANYGYGLIGVYSASRYQGVFAMGDAYKLPADGTTTGNLYGMAWSHPNAGGVAGNLDSHGLLVLINGGYGSSMSYSIKASANVTAYSDERLKTNWRDLPTNFVSRLAQVKVGIYDRIDGEKITQVGVSAQSLQELLPQAIETAKDEMQTLSVSYGNAALASAVELAKDNCELRSRIERLESLIHSILNKD
jgi:hypothetical protein